MNYAYIRFSTDKQDEKQQVNKIEDFLKTKGLTIDKYEIDEGVSGGVSYEDRKLKGLVETMKEGDTLIVTEVSRLGRSMANINKLVCEELKPRKVRLIIITMGMDIDCSELRAMDELLLQFFAFAAQTEKELIQDRTRSALEAKKKAGIPIGGTKELWGKYTGSSREDSVRKASEAAAKASRERALSNPHNKEFKDFMEDYEAINGKISWQEDWRKVSDKLNSRGKLTATGLPFTPKRAKAMYDKIIKLYKDET